MTVTPSVKSDGLVRCYGMGGAKIFEAWKHFVPTECLRLPARDGSKLVVVLLTVRELRSWMMALSEHAYEIFPRFRKRRKQGAMDWMTEPIDIRLDGPPQQYDSIMHLYRIYLYGYLTGAVAPEPDAFRAFRVAIVRAEDLMFRPGEVVRWLEAIGLHRNGLEFQPEERGQGRSGRTRTETLQREDQRDCFFPGWLLHVLGKSLDHVPGLFLRLGYECPSYDLALQEVEDIVDENDIVSDMNWSAAEVALTHEHDLEDLT